ncbi:hypothetical protein PENSPDRAFT_655310 [Peniophora sp. CONT]|nr:hypothetical protein PENSPDRAFT_655310 [Peniophora sp. CONT]
MSAPKTGVYEIIIASPTDAYTSNNAIIDEGLSLIATQTSHPILSGSQVDAPAESPKLYVFIGWDSIEHHLSARNSSEYETLKPALGKVFASTSTPDVVHVVFSPDALPVLRAPVTEIAWCTAKAGANDKEAGDKILQAAQRAAELIASRNIATAYGQVVERPGEVVLIVGWDSLEAHQAFLAKKDPAFGPIVQEWASLATIAVGHTAFRPNSGVPQSSL